MTNRVCCGEKLILSWNWNPNIGLDVTVRSCCIPRPLLDDPLKGSVSCGAHGEGTMPEIHTSVLLLIQMLPGDEPQLHVINRNVTKIDFDNMVYTDNKQRLKWNFVQMWLVRIVLHGKEQVLVLYLPYIYQYGIKAWPRIQKRILNAWKYDTGKQVLVLAWNTTRSISISVLSVEDLRGTIINIASYYHHGTALKQETG